MTTRWDPPGPGPWQQDSAHTPVSQSAILQELYPEGFNRGFSETFARYGVLLDRLAMGVVNGFTYHQPQPFDMPGPDGPMSPEAIEAEFGRRMELAAEVFATKLWRQDLQDWDTKWKPEAIARHRALGDVSLTELDDAALLSQIREAAEHVSAMVYQHHRFNMAAILPVGDFALQASSWSGRPPQALLGVLDGCSPISGPLPDEIAAALAALEADPEARQRLNGDGDPGERLAALRTTLPAVDEYVRSISCRLLDGFDVAYPTLGERPEIILGKLAGGLEAQPGEARARADAFAAEVRAEVSEEHRASFDELLEEARAVYRLRDERGIFSEITAIGILRLALLEAGRRAQQRGFVHAADHMLDATLDEVPRALSGDGWSPDWLRDRADRRRALTAEGSPRFLGPPPPPHPDGELPPPLARLMGGTGFMIDSILGQLDEGGGDATTIAGLGANPGSYEGVARLIDDIDDLFDLTQGEIVVTAATGEAFNSILHLVGAIVTDHGSFACHAAIVAREMGFPAVVGTVDATKRIQTGDRLRVDGTKGEVLILP